MTDLNSRQQMNIVIAGHVDHGKSTVIGRLLADTDSLPDGKLEAVRAGCERNSKPFEYAFLLDALKDEQAQGITIDAARVFFKTGKRDYIIIDAPGHIEFLKNMVTGASRAECALLVIDAAEGVRENSRRHGYMISMLGIKQLIVLVNKMDLVGYRQDVFESIRSEYSAFLSEIGAEAIAFIPVSGMQGDNIAESGGKMDWYSGITVLEALDRFTKEAEKAEKAFRMPVQDVYKFTGFGDSRRTVAGTVETGCLNVGDEVIFYPSGKRSRVKSFEAFNESEVRVSVGAGRAAAFTLDEQIYIRRGEIAARADEAGPCVSSRLRVNLFWLGRRPVTTEHEYLFKCGTLKVPARVEEIKRVIDASSLGVDEAGRQINRNDTAECVLKLKNPAAFDIAAEYEGTGRFVIVDDYEIAGGGIIREALTDKQEEIRGKVMLRNFKWEKGHISPADRAARYNQKPQLILVTGGRDTGKKVIAKRLEEQLFINGKYVYFLGIGNVLYGVDADIKGAPGSAAGIPVGNGKRSEHIRRLSEVCHLLLDTGLILIVTAIDLNQGELEVFNTVVGAENIETLWVGSEVTTDINYDHYFADGSAADEACEIVIRRLQEKAVIFKAW
ncbi:MAG: GTP-binding protein [Spirochaetales bacterium]|uniref:sulfate adenylyltransferase n=1 Tax=Candidatus Thalassospirochaeta sargassi TaxID=3119039 RepID=A0AAJ1IDF7_9SPIO|nr:GTP-binding protein [Spirochaetales bacterium]